MLSSFRREGTTIYSCKTLECNWQEERAREEAGETVYLDLMGGAVVRAEEPDISIAPPTRTPGVASNGKLEMALRSTRSRTTNDSSRQGADDGFREYTSMSRTFFLPPEDRPTCPIAHEPYYHGVFGGPVQIDGRSKTRVGPENREKNSQFEENRVPDGERRVAMKTIRPDNFHLSMRPRITPGTNTGGFGSILPRHPEGHSSRMLTSTAMASWTGS